MMAAPNKPEKSTYFDRVIADFIGKRYGAGEGFYGKRLSAMSEEEYAEQFGQNVNKQDFEAIEMTENAVLVVGGEEDIAQWIVFDLAEKGFNVRVATTSRKRAVFVFGLPGFNVDITELKGASEELYARAVAGTQAIIFCGNFRPVIDFGPLKKDAEDEVAMSLKIMDIAVRARMANVGNIKKIVVLSRYLPPNLLVKRGPITMMSDGDIYKAFRRTHNDFENIVKSSNYDYAIVRAPHFVQTARAGSKYALSLLENDYQDALGVPRDTQAVLQRVDEVRNTAAILWIGALDLAEVVVQSLLQEIVTGISFAVFETEPLRAGFAEASTDSETSGTAEQGQPGPKSDRVRRRVSAFCS